MAQTLPTPAGQPPDATRTAAGQVVTLAAAEVPGGSSRAMNTAAAVVPPRPGPGPGRGDRRDCLAQVFSVSPAGGYPKT